MVSLPQPAKLEVSAWSDDDGEEEEEEEGGHSGGCSYHDADAKLLGREYRDLLPDRDWAEAPGAEARDPPTVVMEWI
jgi:hypothetical protein